MIRWHIILFIFSPNLAHIYIIFLVYFQPCTKYRVQTPTFEKQKSMQYTEYREQLSYKHIISQHMLELWPSLLPPYPTIAKHTLSLNQSPLILFL